MPEQDKYKVLYDAVSTDYNIGTFDEFKTKLNNPDSRKAFYDGVGAEYELGTFDEFNQKLSPPSTQAAPPTQPTGQPEVKKKSTPVGSSGGEFLSNKYTNKSPEILHQAVVDYESIPKLFNTKSADNTIKDVEKYLGVDIKSKLTKEQLDQVRRGEKPTITKKVSPAAGSYLSTAINNDRKAEAIKKVDSPTEGELSYNVYTSNGGALDFDAWKVYEKDRLSKVDFAQNEIKVKSAPLTVDELPEGISTPSSLAIQQLNNLSKSSGNNFDQINNDIGGYVASYLEDLNKKDPQVYDSYKALIENTPESGFRMVPDTDNLSVKPIDRKTGLPVDGTKLYAVNEKMSHGQLGAMRDLKIGIQSKMVTDMSVTYGKMSEINNKYKHLEATQKINEGLKTEIATYEQIISNANSEYATEEDKQSAASIQGAYERAVNQFNANNQKLSSTVSPEDTAMIAELKSQYVDLQKKYMSTGRYFEAFDKEYQRIQNKSGELQTHDGIVDGIGDAVSGIYNSFVEGKLGGLSSTTYRAALAIPSMLGSNWANTQIALLDLNTKNKDLSYVAPAGFLPGVRLVKYGDMTDAQKETFGKYNPGVDVNKLKESDFVKAEVDEMNYFNLGVTAVSEVITMYTIYNKGAQLISGLTGMGMNTSSTIATSLSSFDDYYSQALNTELSESERYGFASVMSLFEGVTNQIMPDYKVFEGLDGATVKGLVQTFQRGGHKALTESLVNFGVMLLKETSEEAAMVFLDKLNQVVVNTMKDKQVFKEVDVTEGLIEATILTAATMGLARSPAGLSSLNEVFNTENVDATKIMHLADDLNFADLPKVIQELIEGNKISVERGTQIMDIVTGVRGIKSKLPESLRGNYRAIQLLGQRESLVAQLKPTTKGDFIDINQDVKTQISEVEKQLKGLMALSKYESENVKDVTYSESINPDNGKKVYSKIQDGETTIMSRKDFLADIKELRSFGSKITNKGGTVLVENVNGKLNIYNEKTTEEFTNWYQGYKSETKGKREFDFKTNEEKQTFIADFTSRINPVIAKMAKPILDALNSEINSGKISSSNITMIGDSLLSSGHLGQSQGVTYDSNRQTFVGLDSKGVPNGQQIPLSRIKGSTDWINPLTFTRDTIIHELAAHPYVTSLTEEAGHSDGTTIDFSNQEEAFQELMSAETDKLNPQAQVLRKGFELIKGTKYETAVRNSSYQGEFGILEEALVTAIGDRGAQLVGKEKSKFQEFLDDVLQWLNNTLFKNRGITKEEFENMSLRQYLDGINADLFQQGENVVSSKKTGKFSLKTVTNKLGAIFDNNPTEFEKLKTKSIFAYEQQQTKENSFNKPVMEGRSIAEAAEIYSGVLNFTRGFREGNTAENQQRLREYAKANDIYLPSSEQFQHGTPKVGEESAVFLQEDEQSVVKLTIPNPNLEITWYDLFDNHLAQGLLFPHLSYSFIGFTERSGGKLAAVFSQRAVPVNESTPEQIEKWGLANGFDWAAKDVLDNPRLGVMLTDLHSKNVLVDGNLLNFIDPMIVITNPKKFYTSVIADVYKDNEAEGLTDIVNLVDNTSDVPNDNVTNTITEGAKFSIVGGDTEVVEKVLEKVIPKNESFAFAISTLPIEGTINYKDIHQSFYALPFDRYVNSPEKIDKEIASAYKIYEFLKDGGKLYNNVILLDKNGKILDGNNRVKAQLALGITDFKYAVVNDKIFKQSNYKTIAEAYQKAKTDSSNPELVKVVEEILNDELQNTTPKRYTKFSIDPQRIIQPSKPISEMNSEEMGDFATKTRQALKKQDKEFEGKTEQEKEDGGYYDVIDEVEDLRDASERINFIETAENINDLANSIKSTIVNVRGKELNEYQLAILNAAKIKTQELGIDVKELIKKISSKIVNQYTDIDDAKLMVKDALDKLIPKTEPKSLFQIVGQKAQLTNEIRDHLDLATKLERDLNLGQGYWDNPTPGELSAMKDIRLRTGWERGKDGYWRYEISDVEISKKYSNIDDIPMGTVSTLNSFLGTAPLLQEYPELQNFKLIRTENESSYQLGTDYFKVDGDSVEEIRAALIHEMQHYVQYKEGYALGGNEDSLMDKYISDYNTARDIYENDPSESNAEKLRRFETEYPDGVTERQARDYYIRLSGEVEARNAEWRLNLTPEERVHRLLYETEQSPRDKQVLKFPEGNRMLPQRVGVDISRRMIEGGKSFTESYDELLDEAYEVTGFTPTFRGLQMAEGDVREELKSPTTRSTVKFSITSSLEGETLTKIKQQLIKEGYSVDDTATLSVYRPTGSITAPMFSTGLEAYNSFLLPLFIDRTEVVNFLGRAGVQMDIPFAPKFQISSSLPQDEVKDVIAQGLAAMYSPELIRNQLIQLYGIKTKAGINELDSLFETVYSNSQGKGLDLKKRRSALRSFKTAEQAYDFYVAETLDDMVNQWRGMDAVDKSLVKDGMLTKGGVGVMIQRILELEEIGETDTPEYNELLTKIKETGTEYGKALNMFKLLHENTVDKVKELDKLASKYGRTLPDGIKKRFKDLFDKSKKLKSDISIGTGVLPIQDIAEMKKKLEEVDTQIEILYRKFNPASTSLIELFGNLKGNLFKVATLFANGVINTANAVVNATVMSPYIAKMTFTNGTAYLSVRDITTGIVKSIPITMKNIKASYTRGAYTNAAGDAIGGKDSRTFLRYFRPLTEVIGATYDKIFTDLSTDDIATNRNFLLKDGKISAKDIMTKLVSGTIGANSDFMLRSLVTGDVPFSNASYFQHLRRLGRSEGLDSRGLKAFVDNPPSWAHDLAVQDSRISTYTQENPVTKGLSSAKRYFKNNATSAKSSGARALGGFGYIASEIIMPFTHVPMNFIWHIMKIANPNLYLVEGSLHGFTLRDINNKLKDERAKDRPNEDTIKHLSKQKTSITDKISKATYMAAASHTVVYLFKMGAHSGAFYGSGDDRERKEIRKNNRDKGRVNSMNVSKFLRYLNRDPSKPWNPEGEDIGDYKMRLDKIATIGLLPIIIANNAEKEKFANRKKGIVENTADDLGNTFGQLFSLSENFSSTLSESLQQTFLQTVSKISDVVRNGDERNFSVIIGDLMNTLITYTVVPNNIVGIEQASRDYIPSSNRSLGTDNEFGTMDRIEALAKAKLNIKGSTITDGFGRDIPQTPEDYWMGDSFLARLYYHSVSITKVEKIGDKSQLQDGEKIFMALDDYLTNNTAKGVFTEDFPTKLKDKNGITQTMNVEEIDRYKREMGALRLGLVNKIFPNPEYKALLTLNHPYTKGDLDRLNEINTKDVKTPADIEEKKKLVEKLSDLTKIDIMDKDGNLLGEWEKYYDLGKITGSTYNNLAQDVTRTVIKDSFGKTLKEIEEIYNNHFLYNVMKTSEDIPSNLVTAEEEKAYRDPKIGKEFSDGVEDIKKTLNVKF